MSLESLSDILAMEGLKEAADTFFGKRSNLERDIDIFYKKVKNLQRSIFRIDDALRSLFFCLLGEQNFFDQFWQKLGLDSEIFGEIKPGLEIKLSVPFALGARSRYTRLISRIYKELCLRLETYLNGEVYDDPKFPGRKLRTVYYAQIKEWCERINLEVDNVNNNYQASGALQFARRIGAAESAQNSIANIGNLTDLNSSMSFTKIDFSALGLKEYPLLPSPEDAQSAIKDICHAVYKSRSKDVLKLLEGLSLK